MMNRTVFAVTVALALGSTLYLAAQQPAPPPVPRPGLQARRRAAAAAAEAGLREAAPKWA